MANDEEAISNFQDGCPSSVRIMDGKFHDSNTSGDLIRINKHLSQRNDTPIVKKT